MMRSIRVPIAIVATAIAVMSFAVDAARARSMGHVFDWSHELNIEEHPRYRSTGPLPMPTARWLRTVDGILNTAGRHGLWFSGFAALPIDIPVSPREPRSWRTLATAQRLYDTTGLSWDANVEAYAAKDALCVFPRRPTACRPTGVVFQPGTAAPTRRMSLLDPAYRRRALEEIRRIVPPLAGRGYVWSFTGSDEPIVVLPQGRATRSALWRRQSAEVTRDFGFAPPVAGARPSRAALTGLRWLAYSRWTSREFFQMKAEQAATIRRLAPDARVTPNDYGFIDGFMPWDYTQLGAFADITEADPYVSYAERGNPGRGRYNPGFAAKFLSDLSGTRTRIVIQAFPYASFSPGITDVETWTSQALRAGATDVSLFARQNPRFTDPALYTGMLALAARLRGIHLPAPPVDPSTVVVYSLMSEGQAQPWRTGDSRYRASGDALYTTYALLGELNHAPFRFDTDQRLEDSPGRLAQARVVWLPRGDTLSRPFAVALHRWVLAGGFLVVTDPTAFTRTPDNASLSDVGAALMGGHVSAAQSGGVLLMQAEALAASVPPDVFGIPVDDRRSWSFTDVAPGGRVVATHLDQSPAAVLRDVGRGHVLSFAADPMTPGSLVEPLDVVTLVGHVQRFAGGTTDAPAWSWRIPDTVDHLPWEGAYRP
ncbi:MAG: hypothetical protein EXQ74_00945 [Thermoleophilia bacterium]|nr:hypothetical protein [Thermoleophilia bacterium]